MLYSTQLDPTREIAGTTGVALDLDADCRQHLDPHPGLDRGVLLHPCLRILGLGPGFATSWVELGRTHTNEGRYIYCCVSTLTSKKEEQSKKRKKD